MITDSEIRQEAETMLFELEETILKVVLVPAPEQRHSGHCIRAVQMQNAVWYQNFCAKYLSVTGRRRKALTFIKRRNTVKGLNDILAGKRAGVYIERLIEFIELELIKRRATESEDVDFSWLSNPYKPRRMSGAADKSESRL